MRALSLWQPHATLMALVRPEPNPRRLAEKVFETRPMWAKRVPLGPLVIHAAQAKDDIHVALDDPCRGVWRRHFPTGTVLRDVLPFGAAIAVVDVVAVWETLEPRADGDRWRLLRGCVSVAEMRGIPPSTRAFGDFSPGRILLQCENVRPLAKPVPMRGYQQIWNLTPEQVEAVNAHLAQATEVAP